MNPWRVYQAMGLWKLCGYITVIKQYFILRIHRKSMSFNEWRLIIVYLQGMGFLLFALGFIDCLFSWKGTSLLLQSSYSNAFTFFFLIYSCFLSYNFSSSIVSSCLMFSVLFYLYFLHTYKKACFMRKREKRWEGNKDLKSKGPLTTLYSSEEYRTVIRSRSLVYA